MSERLDAALGYASYGWAVFPLRGKLPAITGGRGVLDAVTDEKTIRNWWADTEHNIGVACGEQSGIWALDIDGDQGEESLREIEKTQGALSATVEQHTGHGRHLIFKYTAPIGNRAGVAPGLDVRGDGGYICVAPSYHPKTGRAYVWSVDGHPDDMEPAQAPQWLLELVSEKPKRNSDIDKDLAADAYGEKALTEEARAIANAPGGEQESTLNTSSLKIGALVGGGHLDLDHARKTLVAAGLGMTNHREPWSERQIHDKVERALRDGMAKPRGPKDEDNEDERPRTAQTKKAKQQKLYVNGIRTALDLDQIKPPAYNVPGLLQENTTAIFWSPPGHLKTAHAVDLWGRQSLGLVWRDHVLPLGLSLLIPLEDLAGFAARGRFWQEHHGHQLDARALWWQAPFDFSKECISAVREGIERAQDQHELPLRTLFLDPILAAFGEGSASEETDFRRVLDAVTRLLDNFKTATAVLSTHTSWEAKHEFGSMVQRALTATSVKFAVQDGVSTLKLVRQKNDVDGFELHFKRVTGEEPGQVTIEALDQNEAAILKTPGATRLKKKQGRTFWNALIHTYDSAQIAGTLRTPDNPEIAHTFQCANACALDDVKTRFEAIYGFERTQNAHDKRSRWNEGKNQAEAAGLCGFWKDLVWPIFR